MSAELRSESPSDSVEEAIRVLKLEARCIAQASERLRTPVGAQAFSRALSLVSEAMERDGKIVVTGLGKSGKVGEKIAATLSSTGTLAVFLHPTEGLHGDLGIVRSGDVVLAISQTGNTDELLRLIPSLRARSVRVIVFCGNGASRLVEQSDVWIDTAVEREACPHGLAPTSSTTLALALGDALAVSLMKRRGFDAEAFARNHPGGAIGRRLSLRVRDVMHRVETVGTLNPDASMEEVIRQSTDKKMGAVLVAESDLSVTRLLGIITDGDLRRALTQRERFFTLRARDVMTAKPVTVRADQMAEEALSLMENRPSQISVLPVVGETSGGAPVLMGLVRLHDLVRSL